MRLKPVVSNQFSPQSYVQRQLSLPPHWLPLKAHYRQSEINLHRELNQSGIATRRNYATEVPRAANDLPGVRIYRCRWDSVEVADRIGKVYVIEEVEKLGAQLDALRLTNWETLDYREVNISLPWP